MLLHNGRRAGDYQLVVRKFVKRDEGYIDHHVFWALSGFHVIRSMLRIILIFHCRVGSGRVGYNCQPLVLKPWGGF
jgi:hypothetical protein